MCSAEWPAIAAETPEALAGVAEFTTAQAPRPDHSTETRRLLEDMLSRAVRAAFVRARSAAITTADRRGAFPHAEAPASAAAGFAAAVGVDSTAAVAAGVGNRNQPVLRFL